jgi:hypothetical protein
MRCGLRETGRPGEAELEEGTTKCATAPPPPRGGRAVLGGRARSDGVTRTKVPVPWLEGLGAYLQPLPSLSEPQPSHCPGPTHRGGDPVN